MHRYLRAIGFASLKKRKDYELLIQKVVSEAEDRAYTSLDEDSMLALYNKEFAPGMGMAVCGEYNESNQFYYEYAYPYLKGEEISSYEDISIERHAEKESYAGVCDDAKVGVTLIFYIQNIISYVRARNSNTLPIKNTSVSLSALSVQGTIVLPLKKDESGKARALAATNSRAKLIAAARQGDEEAIENLTLEDMDTYAAISKKIYKNDVFTIVDTYFMPYGVECDQYSIMGEILEISEVKNSYTGEEIYVLKISCNELIFNVSINKIDLYGEPKIGRRFKGVIWLQGYVNYPNE